MMRKLTILNCTIAAVVLLLNGCETDRRDADVNADTAAIETIDEQAAEAWKARDLNTYVGFFAEDAIVMPPGVASLRGKDAWRAWLEPGWNDVTVVDLSSSSEEIVVIDDWAFQRHINGWVEIDEVGGETTQYYFKGIWILRRQEDGSWKIARYIFNENVPPD